MHRKKRRWNPLQKKITALYERLSRDDEQQSESNSITNQKKYLEDFAKANGFHNIRHFTDDGYTGTNFNRPGFNALLEEINAGNVAILCIKDMSRIGRNYLQVGFYTEILFPQKGVRFIAVNNNIDSDNPTDNDFTPFLNIMNEWYAKDTSKKIKAVFRNRMENGLRCSGSTPYGFYRNPEEKQHFYIDEEAAAVVRRIFNMAANGISVANIRDTLKAEKVLIPAAYQAQATGRIQMHHSYSDPYRWSTGTVVNILERQEYLGHTVLGKTVCENFKTKQRRRLPPDQWLFFPNTHEAIVDQDTWDMANKLRKRSPRRVAKGTYTHRLSGLVFCADCGSRMGYSAPPYERIVAGTVRDSDSSYQCGNYRGSKRGCSSHHIKASDLEAAILHAVQTVSQDILQDETDFINQLMTQWKQQHKQQHVEDQKELSRTKKRLAELDSLIQGLYESKINGTMPERQIQKLISRYDEEQLQLESRVLELEKATEATALKEADITRFTALVKKYKHITELTDPMLYSLIDRVEVHAATGGNTRYRQQQIDIHFSFVGHYLPSVPSISEEERIAQIDAAYEERLKQKRKKSNKRRDAWLATLKEDAPNDPESAAKLERYYEKRRASGKKHYYKQKAKEAEDPEIIARKAERQKRAHFNKMTIAELDSLAETDAFAAEVLRIRREKAAEKNRKAKERRTARAAADPEYAALLAARQAASKDKRNEKTRAARATLKERAKNDPDAAAEYEALKEKERRNANRYNAEKRARLSGLSELVEPEVTCKITATHI